MLWKLQDKASFRLREKEQCFYLKRIQSHPFIHSLIWQPISDAETEVCVLGFIAVASGQHLWARWGRDAQLS